MNKIDLKNKIAVVTGGAQGFGLAISKRFIESGATVVIWDIDSIATKDAIKIINSKKCYAFPIDITNYKKVKEGIKQVLKICNKIDIFVNNAATNPYAGPTLGVSEAQFDKTFQVNLRGPLFWCSQVWDQHMKDNPGVIINIASVGGIRAEGNLGVYNLTKAALIHLTRQLAGELGLTRVVGIAPGLVKTDFAQMLVDNYGDSLAKRLPRKRLGEPEDIANLATFLASDAASWITGETYVIDGGAGVASGAM